MRVLPGSASPDRERAWWCGSHLLTVLFSVLLAVVACGCGGGVAGVEEGQGGTVDAPHAETEAETGEKTGTETRDKAGAETGDKAGTEAGTEAGAGHIVCLDPGHAETPYRIDAETGLNTQDWANEPEMHIVYDLAVRAKGMLESGGVEVVMTKRTVGDPVDLKQRAVIANSAGAELILHIHTDPGVSGFATFYPGASPYDWKGNSDTGRKAYIDPGVQAESQRLAAVFHAAAAAFLRERCGVHDGGTVMENRGATGTGNYGPIYSYDIWSKVPTFTIEFNQGFADAHRQEAAEAIAEGIRACLREK